MKLLRNALFPNVYEVDCFQKEFLKMTEEQPSAQPPYPRYQKWLIQKLEVLSKYGKEAVKLEGFEKLNSSTYDLYSIRYPRSKQNPRVIYIYCEDDKILLLTAFKEKSSSDYTRAMKRAINRLKVL